MVGIALDTPIFLLYYAWVALAITFNGEEKMYRSEIEIPEVDLDDLSTTNQEIFRGIFKVLYPGMFQSYIHRKYCSDMTHREWARFSFKDWKEDHYDGEDHEICESLAVEIYELLEEIDDPESAGQQLAVLMARIYFRLDPNESTYIVPDQYRMYHDGLIDFVDMSFDPGTPAHTTFYVYAKKMMEIGLAHDDEFFLDGGGDLQDVFKIIEILS